MDTHQIRERMIQLIEEGATLDPSESGQFHQWVESSHQVLESFSPSLQQFEVFCQSDVHSRQMQTEITLRLLMLAAARIED